MACAARERHRNETPPLHYFMPQSSSGRLCQEGQVRGRSGTTRPRRPVAVRTAQAEARTLNRTVSVTGSLNPDETVTVSSEVAGRVSRILADFGQPVRKGQVLVELDKQELQFQLDRAKANLSQAQARLGLNPGAAGEGRDHGGHAAGVGADGRRAHQVRQRPQAGGDRRHLAGALHRTREGLPRPPGGL